MISIGEKEFKEFHSLIIKEFEIQLKFREYCIIHNKELISETCLTDKNPVTFILKFKVLNK